MATQTIGRRDFLKLSAIAGPGPAWVSPDSPTLARARVVGMIHGFGHWALGPVAQGKGTNDTQFIPGKADPISGMAAHKDGAVRVYK